MPISTSGWDHEPESEQMTDISTLRAKQIYLKISDCLNRIEDSDNVHVEGLLQTTERLLMQASEQEQSFNFDVVKAGGSYFAPVEDQGEQVVEEEEPLPPAVERQTQPPHPFKQSFKATQ